MGLAPPISGAVAQERKESRGYDNSRTPPLTGGELTARTVQMHRVMWGCRRAPAYTAPPLPQPHDILAGGQLPLRNAALTHHHCTPARTDRRPAKWGPPQAQHPTRPNHPNWASCKAYPHTKRASTFRHQSCFNTREVGALASMKSVNAIDIGRYQYAQSVISYIAAGTTRDNGHRRRGPSQPLSNQEVAMPLPGAHSASKISVMPIAV